ncbi:hypothetical protein ACLOJK_038911 [Asimina triloba]
MVIEKVGKDGGNRESKCQLYNLKEVEMRGSEGRDFELDLIELLFKSAIVLERMTLIAPQLDLQSARRSALSCEHIQQLHLNADTTLTG